MSRFRAPGATADDIPLTKGPRGGVLAVDELSIALEDVEYFFDGVVVVVGERCFAGGDANDRHAELLGSESGGDVPAFCAVTGLHGREGGVIRRSDVEDGRVRIGHGAFLGRIQKDEGVFYLYAHDATTMYGYDKRSCVAFSGKGGKAAPTMLAFVAGVEYRRGTYVEGKILAHGSLS